MSAKFTKDSGTSLEESDSMLESNYVPVRRSDQEDSFTVSTIVRGSNYAEYNEFLMPIQRKLDEDCVLVQYEEDGRCKSEPDSTSAGVSTSLPS